MISIGSYLENEDAQVYYDENKYTTSFTIYVYVCFPIDVELNSSLTEGRYNPWQQ